jgi:putative ABC transport system substrate-binding protein
MNIRRRDFILVLSSAAAAWPIAARAQQPAKPVVGLVHSGTPAMDAISAPFRNGLAEAGYVEGRNVAIEHRFSQNENSRLPDLVADLVRRRVAVIATPGSSAAALAAKAGTSMIPIAFGIPGDPVELGLVASLNRPGGNVTGIASMNGDLGARHVGLLHELLPGATRFASLINPNSPGAKSVVTDLQTAASVIGAQIEIFYVAGGRDIDSAFATISEKQADAVLIDADPVFGSRLAQLAVLAGRHRLPTIGSDRSFAVAGALMTYGSSNLDRYRQVGIYAGRILNGEKPAEMPIMRATKFELVINLNTAKAIGITIPPTLLAIADEVIE